MGKAIEFGIVHCLGTPEGREVSIDTLMGWFMNKPPRGNGWSKAGYRTVIDLCGGSHDLVEYDMNEILEWSEVTYGAKGYNNRSIHISYVGGCDEDMRPKDTRTPEQKSTMEAQMKVITSYHPNIIWIGHNQISAKACPSFNVPSFCREIGIRETNIGSHLPLQMIDSFEDAFDFPKEAVLQYFSN